MRPSPAALSGAPGGKTYMGWWGDMGGPKQKGMITYGISPFKQRAFQGAFSGYIFGGYKRIASHVPYFIVPTVIGYFTYTWANKHFQWLNSKAGHVHAMEKSGGHH